MSLQDYGTKPAEESTLEFSGVYSKFRFLNLSDLNPETLSLGKVVIRRNVTGFRRLWVVAFVLVVLCSVSIAARAAFAGDADIYVAFDSFVWKEFDDDGSRLLKESGTLEGVGFSYQKEFSDHMTLNPKVELFGGNVDYYGSTQSGVPVTTTVNYFGVKLEGDLGRKFRMTKPFFLEPFGGLGLRAWSRDIHDATVQNGSSALGYMEEWITVHARLGLRGGMDISQSTRFFMEGGVKLPLYNVNTAYLSSKGLGPDVTLHPGLQSSLFAEAGMRLNHFMGSVFYDGLRFSRSDNVAVSGGVVFQPRSTADIVGLKLGIAF